MTFPGSQPTTPGQGNPRNTWLHKFLEVNREAEKRIDAALRIAASGLDKEIEAIAGETGVSVAVRRSQLVGSKGIITLVLDDLWKEMGIVVREEQKIAAQAAIDASIEWDSKILAFIEPNGNKRRILKASLAASADRQVQAMITRVLKTEMPLSPRVYRTKALAKGQVTRIVNSGLARGISAAELAGKVREFIDPSTPGGATYAAKRLARTEINNAFHAQAIAHNSDKPWVNSFSWHLSRSHKPRPGDKCEIYARQIHFPVGTVPAKPHPQCFCYVTPDVDDFASILERANRGEFDGWLAKQ